MDTISEFKSAFVASAQSVGKFIHANNAGVAPLSQPAARAVKLWTDRFAEEGIHAIPDAINETERTRERLAQTLGASPQEIAFFQSAAGAISQVAFGLDLKPGDEIVIWDQEYPSNFHPWRVVAERTGAHVVIAKSGSDFATPIENLLAVVTPRTRVIASSWVQYRSGAILDLQWLSEFAKAKNIFTCVDIIQGAGLLPFHFHDSGLDAVVGGSHKWFVSPVSAGYLILKSSRLDEIRPLLVGAMTYGGPDSLPTLEDKLVPCAARFEPGSRGVLELIGLGASLELVNRVSVARISQEAEWLSRTLMHELREIGYKINSPHGSHHRGAIVNFNSGSHSAARSEDEIAQRLSQKRISFGRRPPGVRLALHAFNSKTDIDFIIEALS